MPLAVKKPVMQESKKKQEKQEKPAKEKGNSVVIEKLKIQKKCLISHVLACFEIRTYLSQSQLYIGPLCFLAKAPEKKDVVDDSKKGKKRKSEDDSQDQPKPKKSNGKSEVLKTG